MLSWPSTLFTHFFLRTSLPIAWRHLQRVQQLLFASPAPTPVHRDDFMCVLRVPNLLARPAAPNDPRIHVLLHPSAIRTAPHLDEQAGLDAYTQDVSQCLPPSESPGTERANSSWLRGRWLAA